MQWILHNVNRCLMVALIIYLIVGIAFWWQMTHYPQSVVVSADGIVILTGGAERVDQGIKALQAGRAKRALISGVHPDVKLPELVVLHHIPTTLIKQIDLGFGAIDTAGNAQETVKWVADHGMHSLIVVTSNYHMPRALLHLRSVLPRDVAVQPLAVTPAVLDDAQWYANAQAWGVLFLAYNKYLLTWPEIILWRYKTER